LLGGSALAWISAHKSLYRLSSTPTYTGLGLNIDERLVEDLIAACRSVAAKLDALKPIIDER